VALLIGACDGHRTGSDVLRYLQDEETLSPDFGAAEFAEVLERLGESGFLEFEHLVLPSKGTSAA
jgi:hypothetical protein